MSDRYNLRGGRIQSNRCEINVVEHCNLSCRSCSHLSPVMPKSVLEPEELFRDLSILASVYQARWLRLVGGEPLLHPRLLDVLRLGRRSGIATKVSVVTNGTRLKTMPEEFWQAIDALELSLYPASRVTPTDISGFYGKAKEHGVDIRVIPIAAFRESFVERQIDDHDLVEKIYRSCREVHIWRCHTLSRGRFYKCPQSLFIQAAIKGDRLRDGIDLQPESTLRSRLTGYLTSADTLDACRHCLGTSGRKFLHEQVSREDFRRHQERDAAELIDMQQLSMTRFHAHRARVGAASILLRVPAVRQGRRLK